MSKTVLFLSVILVLFSFQKPPSVKPTQSSDKWKPIVLTAPDEVPLTSPATTKNRSNDLAEAKKRIETASTEQKSHIQYWQQNHIIRWNEIARGLVAEYNVPPRCYPDSSGYPIPNRAHAADLPRYPFANPPYASRVLAYLSVAQHDALLAAHFYQSSTPSVNLPDEAVIAGATADILTFMFPAETDFIAEKVEVARQSTLSKGKYTPNDITIGTTLGKAIAQKVLARAKTDNLDAAQAETNLWQEASNKREKAGEMVWHSIQRPARQPIEPHFGVVKPWFVTDMAAVRPTPPPSTHSEALQKEVDIVKNYCMMPSKAHMDIAVRWADAEFTHTPIGHWNLIACDLFLKNKSDDVQIVRTLAALNRALMDASIVCWEAKTFYAYPRPSQVDKTIHPRLPLPNFASYPSGHSTTSGAAATVLGYFFPTESKSLLDMAEEASMSRVYSALHFKMDCDAGMVVGKKVGELAIKDVHQ